MANKKTKSKSSSKKLESFNRSQEIYKLLEKGIIESEALMSGAVDRPEDDAHLLDLLESTSTAGAAGAAKSKGKKSSAQKKRASRPAQKKKGKRG